MTAVSYYTQILRPSLHATLALLLVVPALFGQQPPSAVASGPAAVANAAAQKDKATKQITVLNQTVGPALRKVLAGRKCVSWEESKLHSYLPRTRLVTGAVAAGVTMRLNQKLGDFVAGDTLSSLLTLQSAPSKYSDYPCPYVTLTRAGNENSYEAKLARKILASPRNDLQPQDVLRMALDTCGNDYWLATLVAHNLLKECTYAGRATKGLRGAQIGVPSDDPKAPGITISSDKLIAKLAQLRPAGDAFLSDKMGPWYHLFGAFFVAGITGSTEMEMTAYVLELRSNPDDFFKNQANYWAVRQSVELNALVANPAPTLAPVSGVASELAVQLAVMGTFTANPSDTEIAGALAEYRGRQSKIVSILAGPLKMHAPWWNTANEANKVVLYVNYDYSAYTPPGKPEQHVMLLKYDMAKQEYRFAGVMMPGVKRSPDDKNTSSYLMPKDMIYLREGWIEEKKPLASPTRPAPTPASTTPAFAIAYGVAVDSRTNQPVSGVAVTVLRPGRTSAAWMQAGFPSDWILSQAVSDAEGRFTFDQSLPRVTILSLVAARAGYAPVRYDALSIAADAKEPVKLNLKLTPAQ
jgi:hypothetical protein